MRRFGGLDLLSRGNSFPEESADVRTTALIM